MDLQIQILQLIEQQNKSKSLLPKICKAAEYENSIFSLAKALRKDTKTTKCT